LLFIYIYYFYFFLLVALGLELRASHLLPSTLLLEPLCQLEILK
jgi:hypothetical protein